MDEPTEPTEPTGPTGPPDRAAGDGVVVRAGGRGRVIAYVAVPLLLLGLAALPSGHPLAIVFVLFCLWAIATLRQRARLTRTDLAVRGRWTQRTVPLVDVERVHLDRFRTVWLAAAGRRPFRIDFVPTREQAEALVGEVRRRAAPAGSSIDLEAPLQAAPPRDTSPLFSI